MTNFIAVKLTQLPLTLSYACTIHKLQSIGLQKVAHWFTVNSYKFWFTQTEIFHVSSNLCQNTLSILLLLYYKFKWNNFYYEVREISIESEFTNLKGTCATKSRKSIYFTEAAIQRCSYKKVFWKYAANFGRTPMPKCDYGELVLHLYWNRTTAWVISCRFAAYFQNTFS